MANKRPLTTNTNANNSGGKAIRFDISQIKPVIMKRSEIYSNGTPASTNSSNTSAKPTLSSCLRQSRKSWPTSTESMQHNDACTVQFRSNVTVRRIPSRHDYSESVRSELWSSLKEIRENALRNEAEFSFDGGQWRNCSEEENFFYDNRSGCLVHPVHVETVCVFNGTEWKPIAQDVEMAMPEKYPQPQDDWNNGLPANQVCIVCDFGAK